MWNLDPLNKTIDTRIAGTRREYVFQDFISTTALFPPVVIFLQVQALGGFRLPVLTHFLVMLFWLAESVPRESRWAGVNT